MTFKEWSIVESALVDALFDSATKETIEAALDILRDHQPPFDKDPA